MQHVMSDRPTWYMNKHEAGIDVNLHTKDINMDLNKQMNVNLSAGFVAAIAKKHRKWSQARSCWVRRWFIDILVLVATRHFSTTREWASYQNICRMITKNFSMSRKWRNWYQNEVDEEIKVVGSRDMVKHNKRSDQLLFERMMSVTKQE